MMCAHDSSIDDTHLLGAICGEIARVRLWHKRMNPDSGVLFSWLEAMHIVAGNPPSFDRMAAQMYWPSTVKRKLSQSQHGRGR